MKFNFFNARVLDKKFLKKKIKIYLCWFGSKFYEDSKNIYGLSVRRFPDYCAGIILNKISISDFFKWGFLATHVYIFLTVTASFSSLSDHIFSPFFNWLSHIFNCRFFRADYTNKLSYVRRYDTRRFSCDTGLKFEIFTKFLIFKNFISKFTFYKLRIF